MYWGKTGKVSGMYCGQFIEVYDPLRVVRKLLEESQETIDTYGMGWYHGSPHTNPTHCSSFSMHSHSLLNLNCPQSTREEMYRGKSGKASVVRLNEYMGN